MAPHPVAVFESFDILRNLLEGVIGADVSDEFEVIPEKVPGEQPDNQGEREGVPVQAPPEDHPFKRRFLAVRPLAVGGPKVGGLYHRCSSLRAFVRMR